ncbi:MAG: hypothetical protein DMG28_00865 [Acidobacteria bacterium]|nr:MAG: hypothetical protein DMG28_00865 [Acidobacteriota bacterium]
MNSFSSDMLVLAAFAIGILTIPFLYRALKNKRAAPSWVASRPVSNQGSASDSCVCGHPRRTHNSSGHCSESRWVRELGRMAVCRCIQFQSAKLAPQALREAPRNENTGSASSFSRVEDAAQVKEVAQASLAPGEAAQGHATSVPQTMAVEKVPQFPFARGDAEQMSLSPIQETQRFEEIPQSSLASGDTEQTSLPPVQETQRLEEIPQSSLASGDAEQTSLPPLQHTSQAGEVPPPPVTPGDVDLDKELVPPRFLDFYGLREQPFGVTPDPAYLYLGPAHREAWRSLWNGIQNDRGFMALIAEPGMGKTTLLNKLLGELRDSARTVFLFQTQCDSREFFRHLLSELGVDTHRMDLVTMHNKLNEILFHEMLEGRRFVLIVDEAQNLHDSVLETIRLLSDFETTHAKLLEIVLAGQPQLATKLARPSLSQLRQRIAILGRLEPLSEAETVRYIGHRLQVAGYSGDMPFTADALALIAEASQGIPRKINNICFNAMALGYAQGRKTISSDIVQQAVKTLDLTTIVRRPNLPQVPSKPAPLASAHLSPQVTFKPNDERRRPWTSAILIGILLLGGLLTNPTIMKKLAEAVQTGAAPTAVQEIDSPGAASQDSASAQTLPVVVAPGQTLQEICLRYLGRFDGKLVQEIRALNPELADTNQLSAGQLIRLPLAPGSLKLGYDSAGDKASKKAPGN